MSMNYADIAAYNALTQRAQASAQSAYQQAMAATGSSNAALGWAQLAWQKEMDTASMTGKWQGNWSMPSNQWFTGQFGTWMPGGPSEGQQTLAAQQQAYQQAYQNSQLYGQYFAPGSTPTAGMQTADYQQQQAAIAANLAGQFGQYYAPGTAPAQGTQSLGAQQQQFTQGLQTQQEARAAQAQQQQQAMSYLNLLSSLRGPADWAKYQQALGSTPGGMRDLVGAAMGQYVPGGGATTGYQPQAASLQSMMGQVMGQPYYGQGGGQLGQPNVYNYNQAVYGAPANEQAWGSGIGVGQQQPTPQQQQQGYGAGTNLPAPNQISAQSWNNMAPSQQQMLLGMYENQGWDKGDVQALYNQSLPKYARNQPTAGTWRMQ